MKGRLKKCEDSGEEKMKKMWEMGKEQDKHTNISLRKGWM